MAIQVAQIAGDVVELVFDPDQDDLHVGDNLSVVEGHEGRGLLVQVLELQTIFSVAPRPSRRRTSAPAHPPSPAISAPLARAPRRGKPRLPAQEGDGLHLAIAKIRRMADPAWHAWDGWIPARDVVVNRIADREMLCQCIAKAKQPLTLGKTLGGEPLCVEAASLQTVTIIAGAKGSGTSKLAKVLVGELLDHGTLCVVFDSKGAYALPSLDRQSTSTPREKRPAVVHLVAGESLRLGIHHVNLDALLTMLRQFELPKATALYFVNHVARRLVHSKQQANAAPHPSWLGIDDLLHLAQDLEADGQRLAAGAILRCLEAIKKTQLLATHLADATAFWDSLVQVRNGGALVIDLSRLPSRAQPGAVQALMGLVLEITERQIAAESTHLPCLFFDDAVPLANRDFVADVVTPARQRGLTSFFVTTMVSGLRDTLLHAADNLFLLQLASEADVCHLAQSGLVDRETLQAVGRRLCRQHSMLIGAATQGYPMIFVGGASDDGAVAGPRATSRHAPAVATVQQAQTSATADASLPLFADDTSGLAVASESSSPRPTSTNLQLPLPSLAQVTATWDHVVKRAARRRRILETILAAARPLRLAGPKVVLGFPPQHRFQQELIESEEYRSLLEEELKKAFGVRLEVTTELHHA